MESLLELLLFGDMDRMEEVFMNSEELQDAVIDSIKNETELAINEILKPFENSIKATILFNVSVSLELDYNRLDGFLKGVKSTTVNSILFDIGDVILLEKAIKSRDRDKIETICSRLIFELTSFFESLTESHDLDMLFEYFTNRWLEDNYDMLDMYHTENLCDEVYSF